MEGALQELEETLYWQELLVESGVVSVQALDGLEAEARELIAIFVTIVKTAKDKK
jgi:four helix bundle protein